MVREKIRDNPEVRLVGLDSFRLAMTLRVVPVACGSGGVRSGLAEACCLGMLDGRRSRCQSAGLAGVGARRVGQRGARLEVTPLGVRRSGRASSERGVPWRGVSSLFTDVQLCGLKECP